MLAKYVSGATPTSGHFMLFDRIVASFFLFLYVFSFF